MRIIRDFCDLPRFLKINAGLTCRAKCHACERKWAQTGTQFVNRGVKTETENGKIKETIYYLCTSCVDGIEANGISNNLKSDCT